MTDPAPAQHQAPNPYVGFDGRDPAPSTPSGSSTTGTPAWGTPDGAPAPPTQPRTPAPPTQPRTSAPPTRQSPVAPQPTPVPATTMRSGRAGVRTGRGRGSGWIVVAAVLVLGVALAGITAFIATNGPASSDEIPAVWSVESEDVAGSYGWFESVDGTIGGSLLRTGTGSVGMVDASTVDAVLFSLDRVTGDVQWDRALPESRCTQREPEVDLVCLTRTDVSAAFDLVSIDPATGDLGDAVPTELRTVPSLMTVIGDVVVASDSSGRITALADDGATVWTHRWDVEPGDLEWMEIDVARYDGAAVLYPGFTNDTLHLTADGVAVEHQCRAVTATPEAWICEVWDTPEQTLGYAPDGTLLWEQDRNEYYLVDTYGRIGHAALLDQRDGSVALIDPVTGSVTGTVDVGSARDTLTLAGDADHVLIATDDSISLLTADEDGLAWTTPVTDEYLNIARSAVVGDLLVLDGELARGIDLATGDVRWEHDGIHDVVVVHGNAVLTVDLTEVRRLDVG